MDYLTEYEDMVAQIGAYYGKRYEAVDRSDVTQELWLWFASHKTKLREWSELEQKDRDPLIAKSLRNAALKYCEREKAKQGGYDISDLYYYNASVVEAFLPTIISNSYELPAKIKDLANSPSKGEVSDGMNWLVLRSDIVTAFNKLSDSQKFILTARFSNELAEWADLGVELETTADGARMKVNRAINALVKNLGGWRTYTDDE
jgi:hypothetical protein